MSGQPYLTQYKILSSDADLYRRLRLSRLFTLLQETAIAHTEALGFGRTRTLDRGWLWVVALQQITVERLPVYDETVRIESVPGETMHTLYPRHTRICDASGATLLTASSIWALMDEKSRSMVAPKQTGVLIHEIRTDWAGVFPRPPRSAVDDAPRSWSVPYSMTDLNGHMNNARYVDLAEDEMPPRLRAAKLRSIQAEYASELRLGETMELHRELTENSFLLTGSTDRRIFRLRFDYEMGDDALGL